MAPKEIIDLVKDLSQKIINAPNKLQPSERNEEWTKVVLILPLLEGLGWDRATDISYESSPDDTKDWLDFVLKCQPPIGIEAKALDVKFPSDRNHSQVKKGLKQSKDRGASYFIWTNGDCWQFYSLTLENAPVYQVILSNVGNGSEKAESIVNKLQIIKKKQFIGNTEIINEAICNNWKITALPTAWSLLLEKDTSAILQLVKKGLPKELDIETDDILEFLKGLKLREDVTKTTIPIKKPDKTHSFPEDWEKLISSYEPIYERARDRFRQDMNRNLAKYITSNTCEPWSKSTTWRIVGLTNDPNMKKRTGPVISLFREWRFIEEAEIKNTYKRVEESVPYLVKLLNKLELP